MSIWSKYFVRSLLTVVAILTAFFSPRLVTARTTRLPVCPPLGAPLSSGKLPYRSFPLRTDHWRPVATDGKNLLMERRPLRGAVPLAVVHLPSTRLVPVPPGAYPRQSDEDLWQMHWPWIVEIVYTSGLPAFPANWELWAGNVVTGRHFILDSYRAHRHPVAEFFPHFALSGRRVVWEYSSDRLSAYTRFPAERIALVDLATRRRSFLTAPNPKAVYDRITFSGRRIVWESVNAIGRHPAVDLWLYDLRSHRLTRLSRNGAAEDSSLYPRLAGRYLLFEQGPYGSDFGTPYLVDLQAKIAVNGADWWRAYHFRRLGRTGLTNTQMGDGLVSWDDWKLLDVTRSRVWSNRYWSVYAIAGRTVLVDHTDRKTGGETYAAWQIPLACVVRGF